jgi:Domain of unkown function (DUF1775)
VRPGYRVMTVGAIAGLAVAGLAGPALAHVEVSADKTQAGATDVTLTFTGEAENPHAGIKTERVVLPEGIAPTDVTLVKAPAGWTFARRADGFTVGGKELKTGTDAVWSVKIAKLPADATRLSFKTLETYGDGEVDRWIEIQEPGQAEPDHPAPLLTLKPAAPTAPTTTAAAPSTAAAIVPSAAATTAQAEPASKSSGGSTWWIWVVVLVVPVAVAVAIALRRRGRPGA